MSDGEQLADDSGEQRKLVVMRNDSFTSGTARPVSTASIESCGLHAQGSVKRKDARPPSIMEGAESTASLCEVRFCHIVYTIYGLSSLVISHS